jgi:hypothetical protein
MSLEKMRYDAATGSVIYRSKMHLGLKRNFQVMPGAAWLELLLRHVPDRYRSTRCGCVGWYSNRARGDRAKAGKEHNSPTPTASAEPLSAFAARARGREGPLPLPWPPGRGSSARSTRPIRWSAPSARARCASIALIDDPAVIRRILEHLGLWAPEASERSPPLAPEAWPADAVIPLTYRPVPDIA